MKSIFKGDTLGRVYPNTQGRLGYIVVKYMILKGQIK